MTVHRFWDDVRASAETKARVHDAKAEAFDALRQAMEAGASAVEIYDNLRKAILHVERAGEK